MKTTMKFLTRLMIAFSLLLIYTSCSGEDGLNGIDGIDGATGSQGEDGQDGQDGNANVFASNWINPEGYTFIEGIPELDVDDFIQHDIVAPEITKDILDNSVVYVYSRLEGYTPSVWPSAQVALMPITVSYWGPDDDDLLPGEDPATITPDFYNRDTWSTKLSLGNIQIQVHNSRSNYQSLINNSNFSFRYVIIPSADMMSKSANMKHKSAIDFSNYDMVKEAYNL